MKSPAPLFSKALFKQNLHRFWPLLAAYIFFVLIVGFSIIMNFKHREIITPEIFMQNLYSASFLFALVVAFFSMALAVAIFSYMHNSTATAMVNTLPYKRKTVYISNYLSGLFMLLLPLAIFFLVLLGIGVSFNSLELAGLSRWFFVFTTLSILLYSLAVTIGMFTGSVVAHIVFFAIANFLFIGLEQLKNVFLRYFLYGFTNASDHFLGMGASTLALKATPVAYAVSETYQTALKGGLVTWLVYIICSILLIWAGLKLYGKRKMENAADVIAIRKVNPIFKYGVAFCSSLAFGLILIEMFSVQNNFILALFFILLMGMIGYFAAEMLIRKSYRVLDAYKGFVIYALIIALGSVSIYSDWYGYAARTPDISQVEAVAFADNWLSRYTVNNLQAEKGPVYIDTLTNIPDSLALTYGNPIERVENYSGGYRFIYPELENLSKDETQLLWSVIPGIYTEKSSIDDIYKFHTYLSDKIKGVRNNYRYRDTSAWYASQEHEHSHYNISIVYKLKNGKIQYYNYPLLFPREIETELDSSIYKQLATIAGLPEKRDKKVHTINIESKDIRSIIIDQDLMRYAKSKDSYEQAIPSSLNEIENIKVKPEDYAEFLEALKTDYLSMSPEEMLKLNQYNWGYVEISIDNLDLPANNKFKARNTTLELDFYQRNTLEFLYGKGYFNEEIYKLILEKGAEIAQQGNFVNYVPKISVA